MRTITPGCNPGKGDAMGDSCDISKLNRLRLTESVTSSG